MRDRYLKEIQAEYEAQRGANHAEELRRLDEATARDPMIGELVAERMRAFRAAARDALGNPGQAMDITAALSTRIAGMQAQLRDRLRTAGLPEDFLQPVYRCPLCHDTGYVGETVRERCECLTKRLRTRSAWTADTGINPAETFEAYDERVYADTPLEEGGTDTQRQFMGRVRALCEAYADQFPGGGQRNMLLVGMSGLGKTFMMNCIGNRLLANGETVCKITAYQLTARMRAAVFEHDPEAFDSLLEVPLLLLDDLGVEPMYNNITLEQLFALLNERLLAQRHTIISTNLMPQELEKRYTERICSRLFDRQNTRLLWFQGSDVRRR